MELHNSDNYLNYLKNLILQDILKGNVPQRVSLGSCPILLQSDETPLWFFADTIYYNAQKNAASFQSSSLQKLSMYDGYYYATLSSKSQTLSTYGLKPIYGGGLLLTDKNMYFYSVQKTMKFPYNSITSFVPYKDAFAFQPSRANAKTIYIKTVDGHFIYNIVMNLNVLSKKKSNVVKSDIITTISSTTKTKVALQTTNGKVERNELLAKNIRLIIKQFGKEYVLSSQFVNALNDLWTFKDAIAVKNVMDGMSANGYIEKVLKISDWSSESKIISSRYSQEYGIDKSLVEYITDSIGYGIGKTNTISV